jgi:hypothetical protein
VVAAGVTQQRSVPDPQRQRRRQGEPRGVGAQGADPHRDRRRTDVQQGFAGQVGHRVAMHPDVEQVGAHEGTRAQQRIPATEAPTMPRSRHAAQVHRDPRHRADGVRLLAEALQSTNSYGGA